MRDAGRSLGGNVAWTLTGYAAYLACQGGIFVTLARRGTPEQVGRFALGLAVAAPVVLFANLGLRRVQATDAASRYRFSDYFGLRLLTSVAAAGFVSAIAWAGGYGADTAAVIVAMGAAKAIEAAGDVVYGLFQQRERMGLIARSMTLRGVGGLGAVALGLELTGSLPAAVVAMGAAWMAVVLVHDLPCASRVLGGRLEVRPRWEAGKVGSLAWLALPLGVVAALGALLTSVPSYGIERSLGVAALGTFSALAYFPAAVNRIVSAIGEAVSPRMARHYAAGDTGGYAALVGRLLAAAVGLGAAGIAVGVLAGAPLLRLCYGPRYAEHAALLTALLLATSAWHVQTALDYAMTAARRFRIQPAIYGAAVVLLATLCAALVPSRGLPGVVAALAATYVFGILAALAVIARAVLKIRALRPAPLPEAVP